MISAVKNVNIKLYINDDKAQLKLMTTTHLFVLVEGDTDAFRTPKMTASTDMVTHILIEV